MRRSNLTVLLGTTVIAITAISAIVYADSDGSAGAILSGAMMSHGMMGRGMMGDMSRMMNGCDATMHGDAGSGRPNEQWRRAQPPMRDDDN